METGARSSPASASFTPRELIFTHGAFTRVELLIVLSVTTILLIYGISMNMKAQAKAQRISCVGRLKNIGLSHRIFATDNKDLFPWERHLAEATNLTNFPNLTNLSPGEQVARIFQSLSNELSTPKIIVCPADSRRDAGNWDELTTDNISYFLGFSAREGFPQTFLAGDRNMTVNGRRVLGRVEISGDSQIIEWDSSMHKFQGNACMGDGSVQQLSNARLREQLKNTGVQTNVMLFP